jgi:hypothetical protein
MIDDDAVFAAAGALIWKNSVAGYAVQVDGSFVLTGDDPSVLISRTSPAIQGGVMVSADIDHL